MDDEIEDGPLSRLAHEVAARQDLMVNRFLDKHLMKGKTPEQLEQAGYRVMLDSTGSQLGSGPIKHTVSLYKLVDRDVWTTNIEVSIK
jgi:hypothetical protein